MNKYLNFCNEYNKSQTTIKRAVLQSLNTYTSDLNMINCSFLYTSEMCLLDRDLDSVWPSILNYLVNQW